MVTDYRAKSFLTTQKDMVRLTERQRMRLAQIVPLVAARLTVRLLEPDTALDALEQLLLQKGA